MPETKTYTTKYYVVALTDGNGGYLRPKVYTPKEYEENKANPVPALEGKWKYEILQEVEVEIIPGCG